MDLVYHIQKYDTLNWMDGSSNTTSSSPQNPPKTDEEIIGELEELEELEQKNSEYYSNEKLIEEQEKQLNYKLNEINRHIEILLEKYKHDKDEILNEFITVIKSKYSERKDTKIKELDELFLNNEILKSKFIGLII